MKTKSDALATLHCFDNLCQFLIEHNEFNFYQGAPDFYIWSHLKDEKSPVAVAFDFILSFSIHGNEIIGLDIACKILQQIKEKKFLNSNLKIGFLLGNRRSVEADTRFMEKDLNRSFLKSRPETLEEKRAQEIETLTSSAKFILDLHQTTTKSESPFFMLRDYPFNFYFLKLLGFEEWPCILYQDGKFSEDGESFSSYAFSHKIPFITIELGEKGLNESLAQQVSQKILKIMSLTSDQFSDAKNITNANAKKLFSSNEKRLFLKEALTIKKINDHHQLKPGISNLSQVSKLQVYATVELNGQYENKFLDFDAYALFPKYGEWQKKSSELIRFLKKWELQ